MRVLIADDDRMVRCALASALTAAGHDTLEARDGAEAISLLGAHTPECVILDLQMPHVSGYEVLRWLAARRDLALLRVIILSGFVADDDTFEAFPQVSRVLQKPIYLDQLLECLAPGRPAVPRTTPVLPHVAMPLSRPALAS